MAKADNAGSSANRSRGRVMRKLRIDELSAVDRPAQEGATAVLMKRKGDETRTTDDYVPVGKRMVLSTVVEAHQHMLEDNEDCQSGYTSWTDHSHAWVRHKDGTIEVATSNGHTHEVQSAATKTADPKTPTAKSDQQENEMDKATADALVARLEKAEKLAALNDSDKAYLAGLATDADRDSFLALDVAKRKEQVDAAIAVAKKAAADKLAAETDADPIVYTTKSNVVIRKSQGDLVAQLAKRADEQDAIIEKMRADGEAVVYSKRAAAETNNLPGTEAVRVALLKAVDSIQDVEVRKGALAAVVAGNKALAKAFGSIGHSVVAKSTDALATEAASEGDRVAKEAAEDELDEMAKAYATEHKVDFTKAYSAVVTTEKGRQLYAQTVA